MTQAEEKEIAGLFSAPPEPTGKQGGYSIQGGISPHLADGMKTMSVTRP